MKIKRLLAGLTIVASISALTGCGGSAPAGGGEATTEGGGESAAVEKVVIGTQQMPNDEGIAKALDYFKEDMGVDVELVKFDSGKDVNTALTSGDIQFGLLGSCPATIGIANDIGVEMIWVHEVLGSVESLVARKESGATDVAGLKGKTIAVPFASTAHFSLLKALAGAGLKSTDVTLLDMSPDKIYAAWTNGQIDAAYIWEPTLSLLENQTVILTSEDMAAAGAMTSNVEVVNKEFAKAHPEIVTGYIKALNKAVNLYKDSKDEAVKAIADSMSLESADAEKQMSGSIWLTAQEQLAPEYFGTSAAKGALVQNLMDTAQFLVDQGSISAVPDKTVFEEGVNPEFIEAAVK